MLDNWHQRDMETLSDRMLLTQIDQRRRENNERKERDLPECSFIDLCLKRHRENNPLLDLIMQNQPD